MKIKRLCFFVCLLALVVWIIPTHAQVNPYIQRFLDLRQKIYDPANGYFSKDGVPYHSVETLICEAPDYGHETTSEAYSYWIWLESMYGGITGDWAPLNAAWQKLETFAIPNANQQPTAGSYNPNSPATFAAEHPLPNDYPSILESGVPVGKDPISPDLTAAYGSNIYGMHWLFDCDNFYGYGNMGDGVSTPSYINTFQRGPQESVWETVPHPSWEDFKWGRDGGTGGFLQLFINEANPAKQWRYTNAPDADARAVQAIFWAVQFAKEQGKNPTSILPTAKASKMGDFIRLSMADKYFKPLGVQSKTAPGASGYESVHYLLSWYYAWGGPLVNQGWAWRIGCSHAHFGYQNPVAAYALSSVPELKPISANGVTDWAKSLQRQLEFYTWLQSAEGAIAGGATNSLNGNYDPYPAGTPTFYGMAYEEHPVYHDPGSNSWFGFQAWSMERVAEYYYLTNNATAKALMDKWVNWVKGEVHLLPNGDFEIPSSLAWSGKPNTWNPTNPTPNTNLHVTVTDYGKDLGVAASLAKALIYYAAATQRYATLDVASRDLAKEILDRMWNLYYEPNGKGVATEEKRGDYKRFFEQEVYIPAGWTGKMPNGDIIQPGVKFIDIRSKYRQDPDFPKLQQAYTSGTDYVAKYHRFWAQVDIALANAEYGRFFGGTSTTVPVTGVTVSPTTLSLTVGQTATLTATVSPANATNKSV
ncbi:MAG: glycoside hydrolase family 48 protein, partial [Bacteroidales bacterium]